MRKIWRFVSYNSGEIGFALVGLVAVVGRWLSPHFSTASNPQQSEWNWFFTVAGIGFLFLLAKSINVHRDRIYSPSMIFKYWETFDEMEKEKRSNAARACLDFLREGDWGKVKNPERIEPVLDFLEDLGFNMKHKQLSVELIHHNFDHWIRLYLQICDAYVAQYRRKEPARWEHCAILREQVDRLEAEKSKKRPEQLTLTRDDLIKYLHEELYDESSSAPAVQALTGGRSIQ